MKLENNKKDIDKLIKHGQRSYLKADNSKYKGYVNKKLDYDAMYANDSYHQIYSYIYVMNVETFEINRYTSSKDFPEHVKFKKPSYISKCKKYYKANSEEQCKRRKSKIIQARLEHENNSEGTLSTSFRTKKYYHVYDFQTKTFQKLSRKEILKFLGYTVSFPKLRLIQKRYFIHTDLEELQEIIPKIDINGKIERIYLTSSKKYIRVEKKYHVYDFWDDKFMVFDCNKDLKKDLKLSVLRTGKLLMKRYLISINKPVEKDLIEKLRYKAKPYKSYHLYDLETGKMFSDLKRRELIKKLGSKDYFLNGCTYGRWLASYDLDWINKKIPYFSKKYGYS
jgi:hypothetical protein